MLGRPDKVITNLSFGDLDVILGLDHFDEKVYDGMLRFAQTDQQYADFLRETAEIRRNPPEDVLYLGKGADFPLGGRYAASYEPCACGNCNDGKSFLYPRSMLMALMERLVPYEEVGHRPLRLVNGTDPQDFRESLSYRLSLPCTEYRDDHMSVHIRRCTRETSRMADSSRGGLILLKVEHPEGTFYYYITEKGTKKLDETPADVPNMHVLVEHRACAQYCYPRLVPFLINHVASTAMLRQARATGPDGIDLPIILPEDLGFSSPLTPEEKEIFGGN